MIQCQKCKSQIASELDKYEMAKCRVCSKPSAGATALDGDYCQSCLIASRPDFISTQETGAKADTAANVGIAREYGPVKVESVKLETSMYRPLGIDGVSIPASALYVIAEDLPVFDVQIAALYLGGSTFQSCDSMFDIVFHLKRCLDVDVSKPILIAADGHIMDGCHRIMRAILDGRTHLPAKRFEITPQFDEHGICVNKGE